MRDASSPRPALDAQGLPPGTRLDPLWEVTPRQYVAMLNRPSVEPPLLIDCRRPDEWNLCRINGAVLMPLSDLPNLREQIEDHLGRANRDIVIHCHHGRRSLQAAAILRQMGFDRAFSMAGGIDLWSLDIDPSVPRY